MSYITLLDGVFCRSDRVVQDVLDRTGYRLVKDGDLITEASKICGLSEDKIQRVFLSDTPGFSHFMHVQERAKWIDTVCGKRTPWDSSLYDMVIPMDKRSVEEAARLIQDNVNEDVLQPTDTSIKTVKDFGGPRWA